jgi:hypothetical protein
MRAILIVTVILLVGQVSCSYAAKPDFSSIREGDIIFQETNSRQSKALKLATKSRYTHVGLIFRNRKGLYVLEAAQPVRYTSLRRFIKRGVNGHFVIKRLRHSSTVIRPSVIVSMKKEGRKYIGKKYDIYFGWSNTRIYCTELVWKIYKKVLGVELGRLERLGDFDLSHPVVKKLLKKRYGTRIPLREKVISVSTMFNARNLETVMTYR